MFVQYISTFSFEALGTKELQKKGHKDDLSHVVGVYVRC